MSTSLARAQEHLEHAIEELEQAKVGLPGYAVDAVIYIGAEAKVLRRRLGNLSKAVGDPAS